MTVETKPVSETLEALKWRYATKKFDASKKIPQDVWKKLEEALVLTPTSFGLQPFKFVVVSDQKLKEQLVAAAWNQNQVAECSHFVVFARLSEINEKYVDDYVELMAKTRNIPVESLQMLQGMMSGFVKNTPKAAVEDWMAKQCYIALGNLMTVASELKVDNCPMEGIVKEEVDRILDLPARGCQSVVACALGYRAEDDKYNKLAKVRRPSSELFINF